MKLVNQLKYFGSNISSTRGDVNVLMDGVNLYEQFNDHMEVGSLINKSGFLQSYGCVNTNLGMHNLKSVESHREKA